MSSQRSVGTRTTSTTYPPHGWGRSAATHFVIDTGRNGRGPLDTTMYAVAPFGQPPAVIEGLTGGSYCNPPRAALGLPPTADTRVPLVDAYLWIKVPGESDGSCDIAGGPRAWDYSKYNPWGITGDAQKHFDPLWGMVNPAAGEWFPEHALQLARNADPPLQETPPALAAAGAKGPLQAAGVPAIRIVAPGPPPLALVSKEPGGSAGASLAPRRSPAWIDIPSRVRPGDVAFPSSCHPRQLPPPRRLPPSAPHRRRLRLPASLRPCPSRSTNGILTSSWHVPCFLGCGSCERGRSGRSSYCCSVR